MNCLGVICRVDQHHSQVAALSGAPFNCSHPKGDLTVVMESPIHPSSVFHLKCIELIIFLNACMVRSRGVRLTLFPPCMSTDLIDDASLIRAVKERAVVVVIVLTEYGMVLREKS